MTKPTSHSLLAQEDDKNCRLDKFISQHLGECSRSFIQHLIEHHNVKRNNELVTSSSYRIKPGDVIIITIPDPEPSDMIPKDIPLAIVFEDEHFLVIDKPAGMTVHPGAGNHNDTMANALLSHCKEGLSGIGGVSRPGIVHRLDKDTSGLIVAAKNDKAHQSLSEQIASRTLKRHYIAVCWGVPLPHNGTIHGAIGRHPKHRKKMAVVSKGGKEATTHYRVKQIYGNNVASLVECQLETGRTHQIRVHLTHRGHAIIGDPAYGSHRKTITALDTEIKQQIQRINRQALHSFKLGLEHPVDRTYMEFESEIPHDMKTLLTTLEGLHNG